MYSTATNDWPTTGTTTTAGYVITVRVTVDSTGSNYDPWRAYESPEQRERRQRAERAIRDLERHAAHLAGSVPPVVLPLATRPLRSTRVDLAPPPRRAVMRRRVTRERRPLRSRHGSRHHRSASCTSHRRRHTTK